MRNNRAIIQIFILLIVYFMIIPVAQAENKWLMFRNTQFKFRFLYPFDWKITPAQDPLIRVLIQSSIDKGPAFCSLSIEDFPATSQSTQKEINNDIHSRAWSEEDWKSLYAEKFPDIIAYETKKVKIDNQPAQFAVVTMSYENIFGKGYVKCMTFVTATPGLFWHFSCGAWGETQTEAQRNFQRWEITFEGILSSFVFKQ